jgi:hypothetical protein
MSGRKQRPPIVTVGVGEWIKVIGHGQREPHAHADGAATGPDLGHGSVQTRSSERARYISSGNLPAGLAPNSGYKLLLGVGGGNLTGIVLLRHDPTVIVGKRAGPDEPQGRAGLLGPSPGL